MKWVTKAAFTWVVGLIGCWVAVSAAQATTFNLGEIHVPGWIGLSADQGGTGPSVFVDFPADQYDFSVDHRAVMTAQFGILLNLGDQSPSDYIDLSLVSGGHLLTTATGNDQALLTFVLDPGRLYSLLVADGFFTNPGGGGGYGGIVNFVQAPTPIPATLPLLASALGGLGFVAARRKKKGGFG